MRVLFFLEENKLAPIGGPLGVGYHINKVLKERGITEIAFLPGNEMKSNRESKQKQFLYKFKRLTLLVRSFRHLQEYNKMFKGTTNYSNSFDDYDIVHFHRTSDLYKQRNNLKKYNGIVIVTSHSPIPLAQELQEASATKFESFYIRKNWNKFREMDRWAFENADYILFPCKDAEEPYYNNWKDYKRIHNNKAQSYLYLPTGITDVFSNAQLNDIESMRQNFSISKDSFVVVYAGRHNDVKGYDSLKRIGEKFLDSHTDVEFLIAGSEGPLYRLEHPRWKEVGWTNQVHSLIRSGDVFLLPNKYTYFDLVMIEVLALGKIVVASRTGGNKYYELNNVKGVYLYDTEEEAIRILDEIHALSKEERKNIGESNRDYYLNHLTAEKYVEKYLDMMHSIVDD